MNKHVHSVCKHRSLHHYITSLRLLISLHTERTNLHVPIMDYDVFLDMKILPGRAAAVSGETWEERAFAEDASGEFGGYLWPPRSYTCSYCSREFMSAQALGGHMNVHRRDRALLRQPEIASTEAVQLQEHAPYLGCATTYYRDITQDGSQSDSIPLPFNWSSTPESRDAVHEGAPDSFYKRNCYEEANLSITLNSLTNRGWGKDSDPSSTHINHHHSGSMCLPQEALTAVDSRLVNDLDLELRLGLHPS